MARRATIFTTQITVGAAPTQFTASGVASPAIPAGFKARGVITQSNAGHAMRVGDSSTTSSIGIALASGSPGGSATFPPLGPTRDYDPQDFYVAGSNGDVLDVTFLI